MRAPVVTAVICRRMNLSPVAVPGASPSPPCWPSARSSSRALPCASPGRASAAPTGRRAQHQVHRRLVTRTPPSSSSTACSPASSASPSSPPCSARSSASPPTRPDVALARAGRRRAGPDRARRYHGARRPPPGSGAGAHDPVTDPRRQRCRARPTRVGARRRVGGPPGVARDQPPRRSASPCSRRWPWSPAPSSPVPDRTPATRTPAVSAVEIADAARLHGTTVAPRRGDDGWRWRGACGRVRPSGSSSQSGSRRGSSSPCSQGAIGYIQYFNEVPALLVGIHVSRRHRAVGAHCRLVLRTCRPAPFGAGRRGAPNGRRHRCRRRPEAVERGGSRRALRCPHPEDRAIRPAHELGGVTTRCNDHDHAAA